ncbi:flagellar basal body L-ring protein FlgH [Sphingomonas endophytica]|uniref:Flagellar L-ring protein n=1 Tax=Sphingomonas endophytica TaxID=869719 RepID=A0A7X0JDV5_9SPHN|nr:flagellar basal body L-ring protein FlgH [Sphingomonas endophytica]MBB5725649.1 flagellar L-ring protein precursor FlgH [Sphingomonas endophytica]MBB6505389.1 flagellar L-ring protein precursor FlgH [Sphingomonas endophytica]
MRSTITLVTLAALLSGCGSIGRLRQIGKPPRMSTSDATGAPVIEPSLGDQTYAHRGAGDPTHGVPPPAPNASLFRTGAGAFFHDQRASRKGDVLTVRIRIADKAVLDNETSRSRSGSESAGLPTFLGLLGKGASALVDGSSTSKSSGAGNTARSEQIDTVIAAIVTDVLPNGNLLVQGRQEVRVNFELRELLVSGIVRPQDIARDNSVLNSQLAEARISYGGRGQLTDAQQQRWGQQIYDALFPF